MGASRWRRTPAASTVELAGGMVMSLITRRDSGIVIAVASNMAHAKTRSSLALRIGDAFAEQTRRSRRSRAGSDKDKHQRHYDPYQKAAALPSTFMQDDLDYLLIWLACALNSHWPTVPAAATPPVRSPATSGTCRQHVRVEQDADGIGKGTFAARRSGTITTTPPPGMPGTVNVVSTVTTTMTARWGMARFDVEEPRRGTALRTVWPTADPTREWRR